MRWNAVVLASLIAVAGCTTGSDPEAATTTSTVASDRPTTTAPATTTTAPTRTYSLDDHIDWVVAVLNGVVTTEAEAESRFSDLLEQYIGPAQFIVNIDDLRARISERWTLVGRDATAGGVEVGFDTDAGPWALAISVDDDGLIETLLLRPSTGSVEDPPETLEDLATRLEAYGRSSVLVADVSEGTCDPIFGDEEAASRPIASAFKLYVLAAVADVVHRGDLDWDDPVEIRADLKSLPTGTFQSRARGSVSSVEEFAEAMIATSDNTATDHLVDLVGRGAVEEAQIAYGNSSAERNEPFLTTREFFALKLVADPSLVEAYVVASPEERRTILATEVAGLEVRPADAATWTVPRRIDDIEWFASTLDVCRALTGLAEASARPGGGVVRDVLAANPGVPYDPIDWSYVAFKGGSERGVLFLAWYLESTDGGSYVYSVSLSNPDATIPDDEAIALIASGFDLIASLDT